MVVSDERKTTMLFPMNRRQQVAEFQWYLLFEQTNTLCTIHANDSFLPEGVLLQDLTIKSETRRFTSPLHLLCGPGGGKPALPPPYPPPEFLLNMPFGFR